jgi:carboxyl-terminal processing protease
MGVRFTMGGIARGLLTMLFLSALVAMALVFSPALRNLILKPPAPRDATGIWQSRGYGWTLAIKDGDVEFYERHGRYCLARVRDTNSLTDNVARAVLSLDRTTLTVPSDAPGYNYVFERLDSLPEPCRTPQSVYTPAEIIDYVDLMFTRHYPFFATRGIDWPKTVAAARAKVSPTTTDEQLFGIVTEMLSSLRDGHVTLWAAYDGRRRRFNSDVDVAAPPPPIPRDGTELTAVARRVVTATESANAAWTAGIGETLLGDKAVWEDDGRVVYGMIGDIGLLTIRSMEGYDGVEEIDEIMDNAVKALSPAKAVILDISMNDGGEDAISSRIVGRFAEAAVTGYFKKPGDDPTSELQSIAVVPSTGARYTGPVYLLTSRVTGSAAEIFTLAMRALPNVTHVGGRTRGILSDMLIKSLPNGWTVSLSNELYLDHRKRSFEWTGIPPDVPLLVRGSIASREAELAAATAFVNAIAAAHR